MAARGINKIEGNLVIGKPLGTVKEDSLVSLAPLSSLKEVAGRVTINPTFAGVSLDGLQNLESVGGFTMLARASEYGAYGLRDLKEMVLPNLRKVGSDLVISADTLYSVDLRALESVGGSFTMKRVMSGAWIYPLYRLLLENSLSPGVMVICFFRTVGIAQVGYGRG